MFGMMAATPTSVREVLRDSPRSLRVLAAEHGDGWGLAVLRGTDWNIRRSTVSAAACRDYAAVADVEADVVVAHVRKRTVGELSLANTHPFCSGPFVFAHNGTLAAVAALEARTSPKRREAIAGQTDSERMFAFLLTQIDAATSIEAGVSSAVAELRALGNIGSANFLLACHDRLFAFRLGRTLFTLRSEGRSMIASEPLTEDAWSEVGESQLVVLERPGGLAIAPSGRTASA